MQRISSYFPILSLIASATLGLLGGAAQAAGYPERPITVVVPFAAGGPTDIVARTLGDAMARNLGGTVVVENKPGAGGTIAIGDVARAKPDGYRLLVHHIGMSTAPSLYRKLPFDVQKGFEPIALLIDVPMVFVTKADHPAKDFADLVARIKAAPDKVTLANAGIGAASHLCGLLFMSSIKQQVTTVPYKGTAPALTDLIGGQVDLLCDQTTNTTAQIQGGKIRAYAVASPQRLASFKDLPTTTESGFPKLQVGVWHGLYAPVGTPKAVVERLVKATQAALADPGLQKKYGELSATIYPQAEQTPAGLAKHLDAEIKRWGPIIKEAGVFAD